MNKKMNNKGFSLVELIVVIAIMGILAVTLAPRLTSYIEKTRKAADKEVVNTMFTAVKYGVLEEDIFDDFKANVATPDNATTPTLYELTLNNADPDDFYTISGNTWTRDAALTGAFWDHFFDVVGDSFKLQSSEAVAGTQITITYTLADQSVEVLLDYDNNGTADAEDYELTGR